MKDQGTDPVAALMPPHIAELSPYQPGKPIEELERELGISGVAKLASNENPLGPSPRALEAVRRVLGEVNFYPDDSCFALRAALAERHGVDPDEISCAAGSNQILYQVVHGFCRPGIDEVLTHACAFITYRIAAQAYGVPFVEVPVRADMSCDVDALIAAITPRTRVIFLANPNNPTGGHLPVADFERLLAAVPPDVLLVVDEAYHEYAVALTDDYARAQSYRGPERPLLVVLRTFSKIYGLAGLRVGYAVADRRVVGVLGRVRGPFNVSVVAQAAARAALDDHEHVERARAHNRDGLAALREGLGRAGLTVYPSLGNFVLVDVGRDAAPVYDALLRRGVIVRPMRGFGLPGHVRISVGTAEQNARVVAELSAVVAG